jgi:outer membrane protein OmpA-like peptidoglycan-associated protein
MAARLPASTGDRTMKHVLTAGATAAFLILAGCASAPEAPPELIAARSAVRSAEADPAVLSHAPNELRKATASLTRANALLAQREALSEVTTAAYVAQQQARTAMALARAKTSEEAIKSAEADRERARADMRAAEASRAQMRANAAEGRAASAEGRAATAEGRALTAEQRAAAANADAAAAQASANEAQIQATLLQQQLTELRARPTDRGALVTLGDVLFEFNRADIKTTGHGELRKLAEFLKKHPDRQVLIEGHTDDIGSNSYNENLSRRRAEAVAAALSALGVPQPRVTAVGYGESYPVASNSSDTNRALNRRVEVYISDNDQPVRPRAPAGVAAAGRGG